MQNLESTVQSLNIREIESVSKFNAELQELRSKVTQLSQEINACLQEFLTKFQDHGQSIEHLGSSKCTVEETLEKLMKRVELKSTKLEELENTVKSLQNSQTQFEINYDDKLKELDLLKSRFEELERGHETIVEKYEDLKKSQRENVEKLEMLESKHDLAEEEDDEEPRIALEDQLRIVEESSKAIDLLTNHLFSTVWQTCSKNTFGNKKSSAAQIRTICS